MRNSKDTLCAAALYIRAIIQLSCFSLAAMAHGFCRLRLRQSVPAGPREVTRFISRWLAATVNVETLFRTPAQNSLIIVYVMFT